MTYEYSLADRLMRYVQMDTQSDPRSSTQPSTSKQKTLSQLLVNELQAFGITDAELDIHGYVYATIPSNTHKQVPVLCFCSHVDTAPDCTGTHVRPLLHRNYQGQPLVLPDDPSQVITVEEHPYLAKRIGDDIITASGTTLLGADNKAGVAIIMELARYLLQHPHVPHGAIRILFTPDEEIGRGVDKVDMQKLAADFGYTLDGGERGAFTDENFSADGVVFTFHGISAHPGYARDKLVNALKVAGTFLSLLPANGLSPETTQGREGFVHPVHLEGGAEQASVQFILRDFETDRLKWQAAQLEVLAKEAADRYPGARYTLEIKEQYRNMKEALAPYPQVAAYAQEAMQRVGVVFEKHSARGGTDGARLSFMGLPCPDIFTGEMAFHGKHEYVSVQDMQKAVEVLIQLVQVWTEKTVE